MENVESLLRLAGMFSVKLIKQFLRISENLHRFPTCWYITVTGPLYEMLHLPVVKLKVEHPVDVPSARVLDDYRVQFRWQLGGGWRCIVVEQSDVENIVLPNYLWNV